MNGIRLSHGENIQKVGEGVYLYTWRDYLLQIQFKEESGFHLMTSPTISLRKAPRLTHTSPVQELETPLEPRWTPSVISPHKVPRLTLTSPTISLHKVPRLTPLSSLRKLPCLRKLQFAQSVLLRKKYDNVNTFCINEGDLEVALINATYEIGGCAEILHSEYLLKFGLRYGVLQYDCREGYGMICRIL